MGSMWKGIKGVKSSLMWKSRLDVDDLQTFTYYPSKPSTRADVSYTHDYLQDFSLNKCSGVDTETLRSRYFSIRYKTSCLKQFSECFDNSKLRNLIANCYVYRNFCPKAQNAIMWPKVRLKENVGIQYRPIFWSQRKKIFSAAFWERSSNRLLSKISPIFGSSIK